MKPIGIGQLGKAKPKTRHDFQLPAGAQTPLTASAGEPSAADLRTSSSTLPAPSGKIGDPQEGQLSVDVFQTEDDIFIIAPVAGTAPEDIHISITDDVITIKGRRDLPARDTLKDDQFYMQECFWGKFSRSIVLPVAVDTRHVEAHCKNNILTIRIPKLERVRTRVIKIED